eukprot:2053773-Rhodomonas_salina.1
MQKAPLAVWEHPEGGWARSGTQKPEPETPPDPEGSGCSNHDFAAKPESHHDTTKTRFPYTTGITLARANVTPSDSESESAWDHHVARPGAAGGLPVSEGSTESPLAAMLSMHEGFFQVTSPDSGWHGQVFGPGKPYFIEYSMWD